MMLDARWLTALLPPQESPITAAFTEPRTGEAIEGPAEEITARGYAWAGGGKGVIRVDVTADGGKSWTTADLMHVPQKWNRCRRLGHPIVAPLMSSIGTLRCQQNCAQSTQPYINNQFPVSMWHLHCKVPAFWLL